MSRTYHHGDLAAALLETSVAQVREAGIETLSLRAVAQIVGVSPAAAYHHFRDKEALMVAICEFGRRDLAQRFKTAIQLIPADTDRDAVDRFRALGEAYIQFAVDEPELFRLAFHPVAQLASDQAEDGAMEILQTCLLDLERRGLIRPSVAAGSALLAWTAVHGFAELLTAGLISAEQQPMLIDVVIASTIEAG